MSGGQKQLKEGHQTQVHSDQMVLDMAKQRGWTAVRWKPKTLKTKLKSQGGYEARVHSGQMVLVAVKQEAGLL
jgi:hypothetical protein